MGDYESRMRIEVPNELLRSLKLGDIAKVTITGDVVELIAGKDPKTEEDVKKDTGADCCCGPISSWKPPAALVLEVTKRDVSVSGNEFSTMVEEEDAE